MKRSRLNPVSKTPHRLAKRFVPEAVVAKVKARSGGRCECWIFTMPDGEDSPPYRSQVQALMHARLSLKIKTIISVRRCGRRAARTPHHILARSQGGAHTMRNLLDCCYFPHHAWIEGNKTAAQAVGLRKPYKNFMV